MVRSGRPYSAPSLQVTTVIRNFLVFSGIEAIARALSWTFPVILAFIAPIETYGAIGVFLAAEAIILPFILWGFDKLILKFGFTESRTERLMGQTWKLMACLAALSLMLLLLAQHAWLEMPGPLTYTMAVFAATVSAFAQSTVRVNAALARVQSDRRAFSTQRLPFVTLRWLICIPWMLMVDNSYSSFLVAVLIAACLSIMVSSAGFLSIVKAGGDLGRRGAELAERARSVGGLKLGEIVKFSAPFIPHLLAASALAFIDRLMLEAYVGVEEVGNYQFAYSLGSGIVFVYAVLAAYLEPKLYIKTEVKGRDDLLLQLYQRVLLAAGAAGAVATLALAGWFRDEFEARGYETAGSLIGIILFAHLYHTFYLAANYRLARERKTWPIAVSTTCAALLNISLNAVLIPQYQALGAAWATLISYAFLSLLIASISSAILPRENTRKRSVVMWGLLTMAAVLALSDIATEIQALAAMGLISAGLAVRNLHCLRSAYA